MRTAAGGALAALGISLATGAGALDAPHDGSQSVGCQACHVLHSAVGTTLTAQPTVFDLCASCHNEPGVGAERGFPWHSADQALEGAGGVHHRWDGAAESARYGATAPADPELAARLTADGRLTCTVCHDPHAAHAEHGGSQLVSVHVEEPLPNVSGSGGGTLRLDRPAATAAARGYVVQIFAGGAVGAATFKVSNDGGTSFFSWDGTAWVAAPGPGRPTGTSVALNDGDAVKVGFAGTFAAGDRWAFYVSYPRLRAMNAASELCEDCHRARVQSRLDVEGEPGGLLPAIRIGTTVFSHPAGAGVPFAGARTCRPAVLDANGVPQATGDGEASNDLVLDAAGQVRCLTCHRPHNADSNGMTEDH